MYKSACSAAAGGCVEPERDRDGLIAHEPPVAPVENDYSGFDIVRKYLFNFLFCDSKNKFN